MRDLARQHDEGRRPPRCATSDSAASQLPINHCYGRMFRVVLTSQSTSSRPVGVTCRHLFVCLYYKRFCWRVLIQLLAYICDIFIINSINHFTDGPDL